jgi:hypothetical protein
MSMVARFRPTGRIFAGICRHNRELQRLRRRWGGVRAVGDRAKDENSHETTGSVYARNKRPSPLFPTTTVGASTNRREGFFRVFRIRHGELLDVVGRGSLVVPPCFPLASASSCASGLPSLTFRLDPVLVLKLGTGWPALPLLSFQHLSLKT